MKLFYYRRPDKLNNFGDDLNLWLWPRLLPDVFDEDETAVFVGIGTVLNGLLNRRLPRNCAIAIFSTGVGYERGLPALNAAAKIYCLRGPLSARKLGVPEDLAVTDGAILVRRCVQAPTEKVHAVAFMPHIHHAVYGETLWPALCDRIGFGYIDPRWPVERVLTAIAQTKLLLAEAMHGAIIADALRVPWIPIRTSARILAFKWQDWCASLGLAYCPSFLSPWIGQYPRIAGGIRSALPPALHWWRWLQQDRLRSAGLLLQDDGAAVAKQLLRIARTCRPWLSPCDRIETLTVQLEDRLEHFKADVAAGYFG